MVNKNKCDSIKIFEEIVKIPRPSGKEKLMVEFLMDFAKKYNLEYKLCGKNNIIIFKKATIKNCNKTLVLQAHLDMVCEKELNCKIDFLKDEIKVFYDGDFIKAKGTTLGADNGIGIALILHILKSRKLKHCNLECVFTSQEETTMAGAKTLKYAFLKGKTILSLDGSCEKKIDSASASMTTVKLSKRIIKKDCFKKSLKISVFGFKGGHSGEDINKNRANAIKFLINSIKEFKDVDIYKINGGDKANAIPHKCEIVIDSYGNNDLIDTISQNVKSANNETESQSVSFNLEHCVVKNYICKQDSKNLINLLTELPHGVIKEEKNFVITSCNLASVKTKKDSLEIIVSLRSSSLKNKENLIKKINNIALKNNFDFIIENEVPGFYENKNSNIIELCKKTYKNLYNEEIVSAPIHAGLEGGVFYENIKNLDMGVIGPNIFNMHSTEEKVSVSSIKRVEKWLEKIVEEF